MWRLLPKPLLAGSVPDLQFDRLPADVDHPGAELHANGVVGVLFDCVSVRERDASGRERNSSRTLSGPNCFACDANRTVTGR